MKHVLGANFVKAYTSEYLINEAQKRMIMLFIIVLLICNFVYNCNENNICFIKCKVNT